MAGFDRSKGLGNKKVEDEEVDFDFDIDGEEDTEIDSEDNQEDESSKGVRPKKSSSREKVDKNPKGLIIGCVCVVGLLCIVIVILLIKNGTNKEPNTQDTPTTQNITQVEQEEELVAGKADLNKTNGQTVNRAGLTDKEELVTDLNKNIVDKNYNVKYINTKRDYVNYKKHRSVMDKGLEVYWFDVLYLNKHYIMQVPYKYFNEMREEGIIEVDLEVLTLDDGAEIISNMQIALD